MSSTQPVSDPFMIGLLPVTSLGFTGTRKGMTQKQLVVVADLLHEIKPSFVHHGDCIGADSQFHELVTAYLLGCVRVGHPPLNPKNRQFNTFEVLREPKDYHIRDKDIVYESQLLIATPGTFTEFTHSGTWTTVRFARKRPSAVTIVWPDGSIKQENH